MTNELEPCPFCPDGGKPYVISGKCYSFESGNGSKVECEKCQASGPLRETIHEAIEAWNTRYERTCEISWKANDWGFSSAYCECGNLLLEVANGIGETLPRYCKKCGARVAGD